MIESVSIDTISQIARNTFGTSTDVSCVREVAPSTTNGIMEIPPSTRNLLYIVELDQHPNPYVFRFSRVEEDVYDQEVQNYALLSDATGIRVPTIYSLDKSREVAPTAYMVMDYLAGKHWQFVAHPDNPHTDKNDKRRVGEMVGRFYALVHGHTRRADTPNQEAQTLGYSIDRLEEAVRIGSVRASMKDVERCRRAIRNEPAFASRTLRLCLADTEIHVIQRDSEWQLAFACDAEWVEFRHRYSDLTQRLAGPLPWWLVDLPATEMDADAVAALPFFQGYRSEFDVDVDHLLYHAVYYQLALWAYVGMTSRTPDKKRWVLDEKGELISKLVDIVAARAGKLEPAH